MTILEKLYNDIILNKIYGNLISVEKTNFDFFSIPDYQISNICNYHCSYCFNINNNKRNLYNIINNVKNYEQKRTLYKMFNIIRKNYIQRKISDFDYINDLLNKINYDSYIKNINYELAGGEPTLNKELFKIIEKIDNTIIINNIKINKLILTNGSQSTEYYINLTNNYNVLCYFSYHPEFANDEHFIDIINKFSENNIDYKIKLLLDINKELKILNFLKKCKNKSNIILTPLKNTSFNDIYNTLYEIALTKYKNCTSQVNYRWVFENKEIILNEIETTFLFSLGILKNTKCSRTNIILFQNNNIYYRGIEISSIFKPNKFINNYNNEKYKICDKNTCTINSWMKSKKYI